VYFIFHYFYIKSKNDDSSWNMVEIIISIKKLKTEIPPLPLLAQGCNHQVGKGQVWEEVDTSLLEQAQS
jgi:hypothetical protein